MKPILPLFIFIDACGWEIIRNDPFLKSVAPQRHRLESVFGFSSTCVPSILSGRWPDEHRNWCYFVYDPVRSPFRSLKLLRFIPKALTGRRIVRRILTRLVKARLGFKGYFDLYNIPFQHISLYDFSEKKSPLKPAGMNVGPNIFDFLQERGIPHYASDPDVSEEVNLSRLKAAIRTESIDFAFAYWPGLDGLLHRVGNDSPEVGARLRVYERWIEDVYRLASEHYEEVQLYVFSDHGMANCDVHFDLKSQVESLPFKMGKDYVVVYDSTMARFWFKNDAAREEITALLNRTPQGRILPGEELKQMRTYFSDRYFGELIFLLKEGVLLVPSHMGERPIRAMHGYHPTDKHSYASLLTNQPELGETVTAIPHIYRLMARDSERAHAENKNSAASTTFSTETNRVTTAAKL